MYAVREVSFRIEAGETYGLVGESGSGKTTTARLAVGMYRPDSGAITYRDRAGDLHHVGRSGSRALIAQPETIICDEIVSALDVSIRSQILDLLQRLRRELGLTLLFISHDLAVVTYFCDRVGVMQDGRLVEEATAQELVASPQHAYTRQLYAAVPKLTRGTARGGE